MQFKSTFVLYEMINSNGFENVPVDHTTRVTIDIYYYITEMITSQ